MDRNLRIRMLLEAADRATRPLRDIAGGGRAAADALRGTRDRLRDLERVQGSIASFRRLKGEIAGTRAEMVTARARVADLGRQIAATEKPSRALARDFERAKRASRDLKTLHDQQGRALQDLRRDLGAAGVGTANLVRHERDLRGAIARTNAELTEQTERLARADARARRFADARTSFARTQGMATGLAAGGASGIATGLALSRPIAGAVESAQEFESVMTDIAQKADLTRGQASVMGRELLAAARAANQLPEALQQGVDTLSGFGLDPRQAARMMTPIGRAATAYKAEIADLSAAAFAGVDNLKIPVEQTARLIDIMAQAGKEGAFEVRDMAGAFPSLTAAYQGLGQSGLSAAADLSAAAQIVRKGTGDSASAATNLENILQKINSPATIRAFKKNFGVDLPAALRRAYAEGKTPLEAIAELTARTLGGDLSKLGFLFEDAQVQQGLRPLIQNMDEYRRIREAAFGATGVTDTDFAERMRDSAEASRAMTINTEQLGITLGTQLMPTVNAARNRIAAIAGALNGWAQRHPRLSKAIVLGTAVLAALLVVLGGGAIALAAIMMPIAVVNAGLIAMGVAGGLASIGLGPIVLTVLAIVAAVTLLAAGVYAIYANWEPIRAWFAGLWNGITGIVLGALTFFAALPTRFAMIGRDLIGGLIRGVTGMLGQLRSTIVGAATSAANWFREKLGIRSPSRLFASYGGYMMQGLALGIGRDADRPVRRLRTVSASIAAAMASGMTAQAAAVPILSSATRPAPGGMGAAAGRVGGFGPITIHVHAAPGQSARSIAEEVARQLDAATRRRAADARASYRDDADGADR